MVPVLVHNNTFKASARSMPAQGTAVKRPEGVSVVAFSYCCEWRCCAWRCCLCLAAPQRANVPRHTVGLAQSHRHHDAYRRARWGGGGKALLHMQSDARNLRELPRRGALEINVSESNGSSGLNRSGGVAVSREVRQGQGTPQCLHGLERHGHGCRGPAPRTGGHAGARRSHPPRCTPQRCPAPQRDFGVVCVCVCGSESSGQRCRGWGFGQAPRARKSLLHGFLCLRMHIRVSTHARICAFACKHAHTRRRWRAVNARTHTGGDAGQGVRFKHQLSGLGKGHGGGGVV